MFYISEFWKQGTSSLFKTYFIWTKYMPCVNAKKNAGKINTNSRKVKAGQINSPSLSLCICCFFFGESFLPLICPHSSLSLVNSYSSVNALFTACRKSSQPSGQDFGPSHWYLLFGSSIHLSNEWRYQSTWHISLCMQISWGVLLKWGFWFRSEVRLEVLHF